MHIHRGEWTHAVPFKWSEIGKIGWLLFRSTKLYLIAGQNKNAWGELTVALTHSLSLGEVTNILAEYRSHTGSCALVKHSPELEEPAVMALFWKTAETHRTYCS